MQIPVHWAEARVEGKVRGRKRVVRRYGWSDEGQAAAMQLAQRRADEALAELQQGKKVASRERKTTYGEHGLPIREEIVAQNGTMIVTRNAYGARCLNEPDVLFADVDVEPRLSPRAERAFRLVFRALVVLGLVGGIALLWDRRPILGCSTFPVVAIALFQLVAWKTSMLRRPGAMAAAMQAARTRIELAVAAHPKARFALYETPAGYRLLALHATADPRSAATRDWFRAFATDPAYAQMCELQACFRARVSAKPWRIGIGKNMPPRPGIWPIREERLPDRRAWVAHYETVAADFAACRHLADLGRGPIDARCLEVQRVHDEMSKARTQLPLA